MKDEYALNPAELETISTCPFCGTKPKYLDSEDTLVDFDPDCHSELLEEDQIENLMEGEEIELTGYTVYCYNCKVKGPEKLFREQAIAAWNIRPEPQTS